MLATVGCVFVCICVSSVAVTRLVCVRGKGGKGSRRDSVAEKSAVWSLKQSFTSFCSSELGCLFVSFYVLWLCLRTDLVHLHSWRGDGAAIGNCCPKRMKRPHNINAAGPYQFESIGLLSNWAWYSLVRSRRSMRRSSMWLLPTPSLKLMSSRFQLWALQSAVSLPKQGVVGGMVHLERVERVKTACLILSAWVPWFPCLALWALRHVF